LTVTLICGIALGDVAVATADPLEAVSAVPPLQTSTMSATSSAYPSTRIFDGAAEPTWHETPFPRICPLASPAHHVIRIIAGANLLNVTPASKKTVSPNRG
jgi:hypothetical protein